MGIKTYSHDFFIIIIFAVKDLLRISSPLKESSVCYFFVTFVGMSEHANLSDTT